MSLEIAGFLVVAFAAVTAVYAAVVARRSHELQAQIADRQGQLKTPQLRFAVFDEEELDQVLVLTTLHPGRIREVPIRLSVENIGEKTVDDVQLLIRAHKQLCYGGGGKVELSKGPPNIKPVKLHESKTHELILTELGAVNPGFKFNFDFPITVNQATAGTHDVHAEAANGVKMAATFEYEFAWYMEIILSYRDSKTIVKPLQVRVHDTSGETNEEYLQEYSRLREQEWVSRVAKLSFYRRVREWQRTAKRRTGKRIVAILAPDDAYIPEPKLPIDKLPLHHLKWCLLLEDERGVWTP